jgi:hypothetical protein
MPRPAGPGLPGSTIHPAPTTEVEGLSQIVQALYHMGQTLIQIQVELHSVNTRLQTMATRQQGR